VVVVGARAAGAATAMLLARAGLQVLVVERGQYGDDTLSTHALLRGGVLQLSRWGLLDAMVAAGTPPVRSCAFHYGEQRVDVPVKAYAGVEALYAPRRTVLDPLLVDAAREAGAEVRFGITATQVCRDAAGRVTGIVGRDRDGAAFRADARITIGADGMGSRVAHLVGAAVERAATSAASTVYGYWDGLGMSDYELYYRPGVAAGCFPTNDGRVCVFVTTSRGRFRTEARHGTARAYTRLLGEAAPDVASRAIDGVAPGRLSVFAARPGFLRRAFGPGWALVGDAGYFKDPITSHGITDALRDAELLARAVIAADRGADEQRALATYQETRDRLSGRLFSTTDDIASFAWNLDQIPLLLLQLSDSMSDEVAWLGELDPCGHRVH
jgi:flavin-dependent dehydrogenase